MFRKFSGKTKTLWLPVKASTAIAKGSILAWGTGGDAGKLIPATAATTALASVGVLKKTILATDADYAVARTVPVEVPVEKNVLWEGDVTSGLVAADVGLEVDLTDCSTIDRSASTIDAAIVAKVISTTKGLFKINFQAGK